MLGKKDGLIKNKEIIIEEKIVKQQAPEQLIDLNESSIMEISTNEVIDIDEFDTENTQLVAEYVKDIYAYLAQLEVTFQLTYFWINLIQLKEWIENFRNDFAFRPTFWMAK